MKIILGATAPISWKICLRWVESLRARGHEVRVAFDAPAISRNTMKSDEALEILNGSGVPTASGDPFGDDHDGTDHVEAARWADVIFVPNADASLLARHAHGHASSFLTLQLMAATCPVIFVADVPDAVWNHPAVRENVSKLKSRGVAVLPRESAPEDIFSMLKLSV